MMYMHYCKSCHHIFMLNGHKLICPKCLDPLTELRIPYLDYVNMDLDERDKFIEACADEDKLKNLKTTYRMYKYSKWYKELQATNHDQRPITALLAEKSNQKKDGSKQKGDE